MLLSALMITWWALSGVDFLYPTFYQWLDIGSTIREFGPQNRFKEGFGLTHFSQHTLYFSQIVTAINNEGQGLTDISYPYLGEQVQLLRDAEVKHLQDVAHLLSNLFVVGWVVMVMLTVWIVFKIKLRVKLVGIKQQIMQLFGLVSSLTVICALIGFKTVFYWLHDVVFPAENDWFFYYQDSLMTTMMKAPMLFAPISVLMVLTACLTFVGLNLLVNLSYKRVVDFAK